MWEVWWGGGIICPVSAVCDLSQVRGTRVTTPPHHPTKGEQLYHTVKSMIGTKRLTCLCVCVCVGGGYRVWLSVVDVTVTS